MERLAGRVNAGRLRAIAGRVAATIECQLGRTADDRHGKCNTHPPKKKAQVINHLGFIWRKRRPFPDESQNDSRGLK